MIRRITSLAVGIAIACFGTSAFAQDEGAAEEAPAGDAAPEGEAAGGGAAAAGGAAVSTDALPDAKGSFGQSGQIAISQDLELRFESRTSKNPDPPDGNGEDEKTTTITLGPALDYFVADSISVGGKIVYSNISSDAGDGSLIGIGPRVGYNLGLTDNISLWPKLGFTYAMTSAESDTPGSEEIKGTKMTVGVDVPVLFHPAEHFFIGLGPYFEMDLSSKAKVGDGDSVDGPKDTAFGVRSVVGGWF
jgi:hypothetical protein